MMTMILVVIEIALFSNLFEVYTLHITYYLEIIEFHDEVLRAEFIYL